MSCKHWFNNSEKEERKREREREREREGVRMTIGIATRPTNPPLRIELD